MGSKALNIIKTLGLKQKRTPFSQGTAACLPAAYKKFYQEWKQTEPTAVHYIPQEGKWIRDEVTNQVYPVQNIPLPLQYPDQYDQQMWGGEAIVQGFQKRGQRTRRVPHFWVPNLQRSVVYSEVLNKYIAVVITNRTVELIHDNYGFDHYLLKTPACDLKSLLPLGLKRKILQHLQDGCPAWSHDVEKQSSVLSTFKKYLEGYTPEEIKWYGYSLKEACEKYLEEVNANKKTVPLKVGYREQLIESLKAQAAILETEVEKPSTSWLPKINPFAKKPET